MRKLTQILRILRSLFPTSDDSDATAERPSNPGLGIRHPTLLQALLFVGVGFVLLLWWHAPPKVRIATFNIETFPKSQRQIDGAFETIDDLDASLIAIQEVTEPDTFRSAANRRLGDHWRFVSPEREPELRPGVLFNADTYDFQRMRVHDETVVYDGARPVVEVELAHAASGLPLEVFVVHLKAGSDGLETRKQQHAHLTDILRAHTDASRRTLVLGDFNSTESRDRELLRWLARHHRLRWATRPTECTGYWIPDDHCTSFKLDHIFTDNISAPARAFGPCRTQGCDPDRQCPTFHRQVSDHCPVAVSILLAGS